MACETKAQALSRFSHWFEEQNLTQDSVIHYLPEVLLPEWRSKFKQFNIKLLNGPIAEP